MPERYRLHEQLGRGGMASVFRATDLARGCDVALKRLIVSDDPERRASAAARFEHEFHTLAQLNHPRVISVFDYGVAADGAPYYTMELLDGGDLRDHMPAHWQDACRWIFDIASSLALLHSRRLLHGDISPRNIRCTRDGRAKLIDFGAMTPMIAGGARVIGTPSFIAPETLHHSALDARTDLFSLGATLYYALTGDMPYPAHTFAEALDAWQEDPMPPSTLTPGIPAELDDLVLGMLRVEPSLRPRNAFEVMQRLAAVGGFAIGESEAVTQAYLSTPTLVGRDELLATLRERLKLSAASRGCGLMLRSESGLGRSRMLDSCALEAKTLGATVLRAKASGDRRPFAIALALAEQLLDAQPNQPVAELYPELFEAGDEAGRARARHGGELVANPEQAQQALCRFIASASEARPLLIAVDDVERIDEPSAAVLAAVIEAAKERRMCVALTAEASAQTRSLEALEHRCERLGLSALTREHMRALFASMFGDETSIRRLSDEIYQVTLGNPGRAVAVAQHLVDQGALHYAGGIWSVSNSLSASDLPRSAEDAIRARIASLTEHARYLAQAHALAFFEAFEHADYHRLRPDLPALEIDAAISELLAKQALSSDGRTYTLANRLWVALLPEQLDDDARAERHHALIALCGRRSEGALIHHLFGAGADERALQVMRARLEKIGAAEVHDFSDYIKIAASYPRALEAAARLGHHPRAIHDLRRWTLAISIITDASYYWLAAPTWLAQLKRDSGFDDWLADHETTDAAERLTRALQTAQARYLATPESLRVYRVDEALRFLAEYVAYSIATGVRAQDYSLLETLPPLLEPFAPLSPMLTAMWQNAVGSFENNCLCQLGRSRARWLEVLERLNGLPAGEMQIARRIANAVTYAIASVDAFLGLTSAEARLSTLEEDPHQRVAALSVRKAVRLEQGDWNEAARLERQAEELALRSRVPPMFQNQLRLEATAHFQARDLAGLRRIVDRVAALAARHAGWQPALQETQGRFELLRGDFNLAKSMFERAIALTEPDQHGRSRDLLAWIVAHTGLAEARMQLGQLEAARDDALRALAYCQRNEIISVSDGIVRMLGLIEAKLGDFDAACARVEQLIAEQTSLGMTGLRLGMTYEARALIAIWGEDTAGFERYAKLTAREYRYGARSPLGARYDALINEARRRGFDSPIQLASLEPSR